MIFSRVQLFCNSVDYSCQTPVSLGFPRQEYWSGLPFPSPRYLPDMGIKPKSPSLAGFFTIEPPRKPVQPYLPHYTFVCLLCLIQWLFQPCTEEYQSSFPPQDLHPPHPIYPSSLSSDATPLCHCLVYTSLCIPLVHSFSPLTLIQIVTRIPIAFTQFLAP